MDNDLKLALNNLQAHIDKDSDMALIIFDDHASLDYYTRMRKIDMERGYVPKDYFEKMKLVTLADLKHGFGITDMKFYEYFFMY